MNFDAEELRRIQEELIRLQREVITGRRSGGGNDDDDDDQNSSNRQREQITSEKKMRRKRRAPRVEKFLEQVGHDHEKGSKQLVIWSQGDEKEEQLTIREFLMDELINGDDDQSAIVWIQWLLCEGDMTRFKEAMQMIQKASGVCGVTWTPGQVAFKCRTCEMDPTWFVLLLLL